MANKPPQRVDAESVDTGDRIRVQRSIGGVIQTREGDVSRIIMHSAGRRRMFVTADGTVIEDWCPGRKSTFYRLKRASLQSSEQLSGLEQLDV